MPVMIGLLKDANVQVRDTAAWTIARICELHITFIAPEMWGLMLRTPQPGEPPEVEGALFLGLKDPPRPTNPNPNPNPNPHPNPNPNPNPYPNPNPNQARTTTPTRACT